MLLTDYFHSEKSLQWQYAKQMGINHAVMRLPDEPQFDPGNYTHWKTVYDRFANEGIKPVVVEPLPNTLHDHIKTGDSKCDDCIQKVIDMLAIMERLDVRTLCFNFMAHIGWYRSADNIKERGGALVTGFNMADFVPTDSFAITEEDLWSNLTYFLQAVVPYAEKHGIKLALHPDDPPVSLGKVARILTSYEAIHKAVHLVESDCLGVTLCQATYSAMGEDLEKVISSFAAENKIFFVHFRDIKGDKNNFRETFHDNGQTDMAKILRHYHKCGVCAPIRVDHVPTMAGEDNSSPGYTAIGRLFAVGYLKGLIDGIKIQ